MRNVTIKRNKSFVGSLGKLKLYVVDPINGDLDINGEKCAKLGELKNGEEKSFVISEEETKIFAIWDKTSRNYCNDLYIVPAGENDFHLYGKAHYNPTNGNAFRFENNNNAVALNNRKKGNSKGVIVFIIAIIIGFLVGWFLL